MADAQIDNAAITRLVTDLESVFGRRLLSVATYGGDGEAEALTAGAAGDSHDHLHSIAITETLEARDLQACANLAKGWSSRGLATPLLFSESELARSLDAFPLELAEILARHRMVFGNDSLAGLTVAPSDIRRACEVQARSHLLHLREGYIEAGAQARTLATIIHNSVRPFRLLLVSIGRLEGVDVSDTDAFGRHLESELKINRSVVRQVLAAGGRSGISATDAQELYPAYIAVVDQLVRHVDTWKA